MRPEEAHLANPDFADDGLEPAERARESKEDRTVHEKNLGKGGPRAFLPRRHPPVVESVVSFARFQAEIPDPDPGDGKIPGEKAQRREGDVDRTGASEGEIRKRVAQHHVVDGDMKVQQVEVQSVVPDRDAFASGRVDQRCPGPSQPLRDLERQTPPDDRKEEDEQAAPGPTHPSHRHQQIIEEMPGSIKRSASLSGT
jgi:hypothetical protein